ncbi:MAG TPA: hypothetical protein VIK98_10975 [Limnochordales bacterium]
MATEPRMPAKDAIWLYDLLERAGIPVWIDGGWAVDALLGRQTREHGDLDIALEARFLDRLRDVLAEHGLREVPKEDSRPWNFVLGNGCGLEVDVHAFVFDENGDGVYGPPENGQYYRKEALTGRGFICGRPVRCISPEWLVRFHTGYDPRQKDFHDVVALCQHFGIELPAGFRRGPTSR